MIEAVTWPQPWTIFVDAVAATAGVMAARAAIDFLAGWLEERLR